MRVGSVTSRAVRSRHESTGLDLFHKLKQPMCGHRFPSLEEVSAAVTRAIRGLNKSGNLNGIASLPKRWDAVIEKQGDYIEGL
jgi:hypothetical protein